MDGVKHSQRIGEPRHVACAPFDIEAACVGIVASEADHLSGQIDPGHARRVRRTRWPTDHCRSRHQGGAHRGSAATHPKCDLAQHRGLPPRHWPRPGRATARRGRPRRCVNAPAIGHDPLAHGRDQRQSKEEALAARILQFVGCHGISGVQAFATRIQRRGIPEDCGAPLVRGFAGEIRTGPTRARRNAAGEPICGRHA